MTGVGIWVWRSLPPIEPDPHVWMWARSTQTTYAQAWARIRFRAQGVLFD
jgi:hypothetical protein